MRHVDPFLLPKIQPKDQIIFAVSQHIGNRSIQEDCFLSFKDECFVVADGVGGIPHGDVASGLAAETAVWGYKHIRLRPYYWSDKKLFMKRIFRSVNIAVWQKQRETGFTDGMATTLVVLMIGTRTLWLGSVGDSAAYFFHNGIIKKLTREDVDSRGNLIKVIGTERFGLVPQFATGEFLVGDSVLLATDGVTRYVQPSDFETLIIQAGETSRDLTAAAQKLIALAQQNGGGDNMTVSLIKRIPFR